MDDGLQTGFGAAGSAPVEGEAPQAEAATPASNAETSTTDSSATGKENGTPPTAAQPVADENLVIASEKGSFELRYNERTGRNEVVSTMPSEPEGQPAEAEAKPQEQAQPQQANNNSYAGNELLNFMNRQLQAQQQAQPVPQYYQPPVPPPVAQPAQQPQQQPQEQGQPVDETAQAQEFYSKVQSLANERAMKEVGITQDELDVAEYTDDQAILDKFSAYKVAAENNRALILQDVNNIQREQKALAADHANAYGAIDAFVKEMKQKEPNFDAIDKMMITRVGKMPYEQAIKVAPLIQKVQNGTITTADLPALQEMYNQTRLEFYSGKTGVSIAPKVAKPSYVEPPGNAGEVPRKTTPLSELGKMNKKDKINAIGQMFSNFLDE